MKPYIEIEWVTRDGIRMRDTQSGKNIEGDNYPRYMVRAQDRSASRRAEPWSAEDLLHFPIRRYQLSTADSRMWPYKVLLVYHEEVTTSTVENAARALHELLDFHVGHTADYPIRITVDDEATCVKLVSLLTQLKQALKDAKQ